MTHSWLTQYSKKKTTLLRAEYFSHCLFFFHIWSIQSNLYSALPFSASPIEPAAKFHPFQEQWEALTSEERSERCLSDKEVCRSHGLHTQTAALFTDMLCFCLMSLRWLMACQSFPFSWSELGLLKSQLIFTLWGDTSRAVINKMWSKSQMSDCHHINHQQLNINWTDSLIY